MNIPCAGNQVKVPLDGNGSSEFVFNSLEQHNLDDGSHPAAATY